MSSQLGIPFAEDHVVRIRRFINVSFGSACDPQFADAANGKRYVAKSNGAGGQYVVDQEYLCALLANELGMPIPPFQLLRHRDAIFFGSEFVTITQPQFDAAILSNVTNPNALYLIAAFDAWVWNRDRHRGNLVVVKNGKQHRLCAIDHSHCPIFGPQATLHDLFGGLQDPAVAAIKPFLRPLLSDRGLLLQAVSKIEAIEDTVIARCIDSCPGFFWSPEERVLVRDFLQTRRLGLRSLFNQQPGNIPAMSGGPL